MGVAVNIGLGIGCLIIALLMALIGGWFSYAGFRDRDWSGVVLAILILAVAVFAVVSAVSLFTKA
ncbi:MAG: hypothetical protein ACYDHZ_07100 [Dehalococcoidia bacterium]